nr:MAG TPA: hypothetical protein [Caudoviricetes sp.]
MLALCYPTGSLSCSSYSLLSYKFGLYLHLSFLRAMHSWVFLLV